MSYSFNGKEYENVLAFALALMNKKDNLDQVALKQLNTKLIKRQLLEAISNQPEQFSKLFDKQRDLSTDTNALTRLLCSPRYIRTSPRPFGKTASSKELGKIRQVVLDLKTLGVEDYLDRQRTSLPLYPSHTKRLGRGEAYLQRGIQYLKANRLIEAVRDFEIAKLFRVSSRSKRILENIDIAQVKTKAQFHTIVSRLMESTENKFKEDVGILKPYVLSCPKTLIKTSDIDMLMQVLENKNKFKSLYVKNSEALKGILIVLPADKYLSLIKLWDDRGDIEASVKVNNDEADKDLLSNVFWDDVSEKRCKASKDAKDAAFQDKIKMVPDKIPSIKKFSLFNRIAKSSKPDASNAPTLQT